MAWPCSPPVNFVRRFFIARSLESGNWRIGFTDGFLPEAAIPTTPSSLYRKPEKGKQGAIGRIVAAAPIRGNMGRRFVQHTRSGYFRSTFFSLLAP
jgi:hypothetical protein